MDKTGLIVIFSILFLLSVNFCVAQEFDNSTGIDDVVGSSQDWDELYAVREIDNQSLQANDKKDTHIDVVSDTDFDVIGDDFKIKLIDDENKSISNTKVTFSVNGVTYKDTTDKNGIASLQIRLKDGSYQITTKFAGDSSYNSCSKTTTITVNNTKVVKAGLSGSEIQNIIDNAKENNVILFEGKLYENVNLVVNKRLTLLTKSDTVLKSGNSNPTILITGKGSSYTTINGFNIQGNGNGIEIKNSDYVTVINNDIKTKASGIVASSVNYLNITKNNLVGNGKNGITLISAENSHIYNNKINSNSKNGIQMAKSDTIYIHDNSISKNGDNGIHLTTKIDGVNYNSGSKNLHINKNTISQNGDNGIFIETAGDNVNINSNVMESNWGDGIAISKVGSNKMQSNVISDNHGSGIRFFDDYRLPKSQDISYNAIFGNVAREVEAKDTYFQENGNRLKIGDNWYSDANTLCPKINSNNLKFVVKQVGDNLFQASFLDSKGNIASLLPDRTLSYSVGNGKSVTLTVSGGTGVFSVDAADGDIIKATVDYSTRDNVYDSNTPKSNPESGKTPTYDYPSIEYDSPYDDTGNAIDDGDGNGNGGSGGSSSGKGNSNGDFTGNGTTSSNMDPGKSAASENVVSQSYESQSVSSQAGASQSASGEVGDGGVQSQSVVKQIIIDEDEVVKIVGISFIILLMILTIAFYYRDDIKEMRSKM